jgi:hypothetical protein
MSESKYFRFTEEADIFAEKMMSAELFEDKLQIAQLGFVLGIKDGKHTKKIKEGDLKKRAIGGGSGANSYSRVVSEMAFETLYLNLFPAIGRDDLEINIQKAASYGLLICEKKFYDSDNEIILWDSLQKYID